MNALRRQWPWSTEAGARWALSSVVVAVVLIVLTVHIGGKDDLGRQLPPLALAVAVVMASASAHVAMVTRGRRAVGLRRAAILSDRLAAMTTATGRTSDDRNPDDVGLVAVAGLRLYHRIGCVMTHGRDLETVTSAAGREPCGLCRPGASS